MGKCDVLTDDDEIILPARASPNTSELDLFGATMWIVVFLQKLDKNYSKYPL